MAIDPRVDVSICKGCQVRKSCSQKIGIPPCAKKFFEPAQQADNIDYTAALREIKQIMVPGRYTMRRKLQYIDGVLSRLNLQPEPCKLRII